MNQDQAQHDVEDFYDREAASYDQRRWEGPIGRYVAATYGRLVEQSIPRIPQGQYLEVGCGTGRFTVPLVSTGLNLTAIDISEAMLATTRARLKDLDLEEAATLLKADAKQIPFEAACFDVVCSFNAVNHIPSYFGAINEMIRVLAPGGYLVVGYPNLNSVYYPYAKLVNIVGKSLRRGVYTCWPSTRSLGHHVAKYGLRREKLFGMFHCPPLRSAIMSGAVTAGLSGLGKLAESGPLTPIASIHVVTFRKP